MQWAERSIGIEHYTQSTVPSVEYDASLATAPYIAEVHADACTEFLRSIHAQEQTIGSTTIRLSRIPSRLLPRWICDPSGSYRLLPDGSSEINVYLDTIWNNPTRLSDADARIPSGRIFPSYYDSSPSDEEISSSLNVYANTVLAHELGHVGHPFLSSLSSSLQGVSFPMREVPAYFLYQHTNNIGISVAAGIACFLLGGKLYYNVLRPDEKMARHAEKLVSPDTQLLTLLPRQSIR